MAGELFGADDANAPSLKLLASSAGGDDPPDPCPAIAKASSRTDYFKSAQWSADGTCVVTNSGDSHIRTFVIPPDLLQEREEPLRLQPFSVISSLDPTDAVTTYPGFNLQDASTALVLSATNEHPIRLYSALTSALVASYPLVSSTTEAYIKPNCLMFTRDGTHFLAGSDSLISYFDLWRPGAEPVSSFRTGPKRARSPWSNPGTSVRGIVSALGIDKQHNVLAAGTLTRQVGLYDAGGSGECLGVFSVQKSEADQKIGGQGITQVLWSSCGRYLYIAERRSRGVMLYDIRKTGQLLAWLEGRNADTNQRLHVDLASSENGENHEVWAGGTDGVVRVWRNPHQQSGPVGCLTRYEVHKDAVSSTVLHPTGNILATVSGQRQCMPVAEMNSDQIRLETDVSLRIWSIRAS